MLWRKKQIAEQVARDIEDFTKTVDETESAYTIGKNNAGNTQFRIKLDYGSATLTMAPDAVVDLIEQLAVTIRKEYSVEINCLGKENTND
jgi:hypothetical protein